MSHWAHDVKRGMISRVAGAIIALDFTGIQFYACGVRSVGFSVAAPALGRTWEGL